jgi:GT2 family glycosyltransferase
MLVSRTCYQATGALDEEAFAIAFNDVDYCLRAMARGFRTVWTPFATLTHHESATRGSDETEANRRRFKTEKTMLRLRHHTDKATDPAFSAWYSTSYNVATESMAKQLPAARFWAAAPIASLPRLRSEQ